MAAVGLSTGRDAVKGTLVSAMTEAEGGVSDNSSSAGRQHLLGGHGVVFHADSKAPPSDITTEVTSTLPSPDVDNSVSTDTTSTTNNTAPATTNTAKQQKNKVKIPVPPKKLLKSVGQAISDWHMIEDGDRILLGLSGGKDSLCMLHLLRHFQKIAPIRFEIACATVDPQTGM